MWFYVIGASSVNKPFWKIIHNLIFLAFQFHARKVKSVLAILAPYSAITNIIFRGYSPISIIKVFAPAMRTTPFDVV